VKAIVLRHPGTPAEALNLEEFPDPSPGPRDVVVSVQASRRVFSRRLGSRRRSALGREDAPHFGIRGFRRGRRGGHGSQRRSCWRARRLDPMVPHLRIRPLLPLGAGAVVRGGGISWGRGPERGLRGICPHRTGQPCHVPDNVSYQLAAVAACPIGTALQAIHARSRACGLLRARWSRAQAAEWASTSCSLRSSPARSSPGRQPRPRKWMRFATQGPMRSSKRGSTFRPWCGTSAQAGVDVVIDNVGTAISGDAALSRAGRTVDDGRPAHW
jgi:hypothetical protein